MVDHSGETSPSSRPDIAMVAAMRCLLVVLASVICTVSTGAYGGTSPALLHYAVLALYVIYSGGVLCATLLRRDAFERAHPWADLALIASLVALTGGTESPFIHYLLFPVVVASFSRGFRDGLSVTLCAVAALGLIAVANAPFFSLAALAATASLFLLGFLIAYCGGREVDLRHRLAFLRELGAMGNPRAEPNAMMRNMLHCLVDYYQARSCLLIVPRAGKARCTLYRITLSPERAEWQADDVGESLASKLLALPPQMRISFDGRPGLTARSPVLAARGRDGDDCGPRVANECLELSTLFEAPLYATVPFKNDEADPGRLYLISPRRRLSASDAEFLSQVASQIATAVSNVALFDELTRSTAQTERSKISRDIHDTTVQSYIGLKIALEALYRDIDPDSSAAVRVKELLDMATLTVDDLRRYIDRLSGRAPAAPEQELISRLEEQKRRYQDFHGINVDLRTPARLELTEEVAGDAYRVVCEALSNVFRHTHARDAYVDLRCEDGTLAIEVGNESALSVHMPFMPRSITERATSMGGKVQVRRNKGRDVVRVTVPLQYPASKRTPVSA